MFQVKNSECSLLSAMGTNNSISDKPKLILVGGFLGAGKTTVLAVLSELLQERYSTVGLITNDQSTGLVDTHILELDGADVEEVSGSCFCCDFNGFIKAVNYLISHSNCELILAEPVGSCTDLSATILQPFKAMFADEIDLAPLSVLVDPIKCGVMLAQSFHFKEGPSYIYGKQLEEADYIVVNKKDLLTAGESAEIKRLLEDRFPEHPLMWISATEKTGVKEWLEEILNDPCAGRRIAQVNYDTYALAEAATGWYNGSFLIMENTGAPVDWQVFHNTFLKLLEQAFDYEKLRIDHLKTFLRGGASHLLGNITGNGHGIAIRGTGFLAVSARLVLNIRAETSHVLINEMVEDVIHLLSEQGYQFETISVKHLTPGRPLPQYRYHEII